MRPLCQVVAIEVPLLAREDIWLDVGILSSLASMALASSLKVHRRKEEPWQKHSPLFACKDACLLLARRAHRPLFQRDLDGFLDCMGEGRCCETESSILRHLPPRGRPPGLIHTAKGAAAEKLWRKFRDFVEGCGGFLGVRTPTI